ncbi:MAG: DEAD/DEAH box helicase [Candidatus Aminicenantes bacterium]
MGYEEATPIQSEAIPALLEGKDIIGQAQTGTGKTAAFGIPAIEMLDPSDKSLQVVILCPTRELAIQVSEEMNKLAKYKKNFSFIPVYGGQPIDRQLKALKKGVQIVIGTPGRILDHLDRGTIDMSGVKLVVLDEADEMLDMGFRDDIELILNQTPKQRQTVMFSATMPKPIQALTKKYQRNPINIKVVHEVLTVPNTEQIYFEVKEKNKLEALTRIIDLYNLKLALVFCNTKRGVDELVDHLQARGYAAEGLHGDMKQVAREKVMDKFRKGKVEILIATDVAARGLDVENVEAVVNYDMPQDEEYYVHRIGRTGRAGKPGKAFTFVTGREIFKLRDIQKYIKTKLKLHPVPSFDDVEEMKVNIFIDEIKNTVTKGGLKKYIYFVERLIDDEFTSLDVAAALFKMSFGENKKETHTEAEPRSSDLLKQVRLFLNVGKKDKVRPGDILGAIAGESGIPGKAVGEISMFDKFSFVNVPEIYAEEIIDAMQGNQIRGKKINIEIANKKD